MQNNTPIMERGLDRIVVGNSEKEARREPATPMSSVVGRRRLEILSEERQRY
jgi:hypothetical protein